jgi:CheY-like chemotaxis protein
MAGLAAGRYVLLAVTDTGTGMDAEVQKRIFEPFFTTKEVGKGTGLGLTTVYGIVKQNHGHIDVHSEIGRGTSFKVYFPRVDERLSSKPDPRTTHSLPAPSGTGTILLVEDDDAVRRVAARILRGDGYNVLEAQRPTEALRLVADHRRTIDLLLADIVMPETSGPALADELVTMYPELKVLLMSGYPEAAALEAQLDSGHPYLEKPFTPASLLEKMRTVMRG